MDVSVSYFYNSGDPTASPYGSYTRSDASRRWFWCPVQTG
jgi:hypothetical protein